MKFNTRACLFLWKKNRGNWAAELGRPQRSFGSPKRSWRDSFILQ